MERLANLILNKLKEGTIKTVMLFSDDDVFPEPPYVVVKPEIGVMENTRAYRIIAHAEKGKFDFLEDYVLKELDSLLLSGCLEDKAGGRYKLYPNGFTDITPEEVDNTYFMERMFYCPLAIR